MDQHRRLVPINVFVRQLAVPELNNGDKRHLHSLSSRRNARQHPVHPDGVGEFENHFVHELIVANRSRDRNHLRIWRHLWNETLRVKLPQLVATHAAGQHRNMVYISVLNHGRESIFSLVGRELMAHMFFPKFVQSFLRSA